MRLSVLACSDKFLWLLFPTLLPQPPGYNHPKGLEINGPSAGAQPLTEAQATKYSLTGCD